MTTVANAVAVLLVLGYALLVLRLVRPERHAVAVCATAVAGWAGLAAAPLAVVAALAGNPVVAGSLGVAALLQLVWMIRAVAWRLSPAAPPSGDGLRLVSANVLNANTRMNELAAELLALDADVLCLQEVTAEHALVLRSSGLLTAYPYAIVDPDPGFHGSAILSRLPLTGMAAEDVGGFPMTRADLSLGGEPVRVVNVHTAAPLDPEHVAAWRRQMLALTGFPAPPGGTLIMAGDFNATLDHRSMARLLGHGLRDAFEEAGTGLGATWPRWRWPMPALLRLDHVLISGPLRAVAASVADSAGSDHRRLIVDLEPAAGSTTIDSGVLHMHSAR